MQNDKLKTYGVKPGADLVNWGPQANIGMGPYIFAHIYQINLAVPFLS